jgi:integrase/recombinase XerD
LRQQIDVHQTQQRYKGALRNLREDSALSPKDRQLILTFIRDLEAENLTTMRLVKYLYALRQISKALRKGLDAATQEDIRNYVAALNKSKYADWSKHDFKVALKRFYRWLRKLPDDQDPPETAWIKVSAQNGKGFLPEELLTEFDIEKMLEVCENSRDRAFAHCVWETGGRIAELLNLRRKHVQLDEFGARLMFSGKTGDRPVRLIESAPSLAAWMLDNPFKEPDSPLWVNIGDRYHGEPLLYFASRALLQRLARKAGIKKHVNPHMFRHSRASYLANHLTEAQMNGYFGWKQGSKMPAIYVHLSGRDVDGAVLRMHGIESSAEQKGKPKLNPRQCPRCQQMNSSINKFCSSCGLPLQIGAALEVEESKNEADSWLNLLLQDPEVKELLLTKLREIMQASVQKPSIGLPAQPQPGPAGQGLAGPQPKPGEGKHLLEAQTA